MKATVALFGFEFLAAPNAKAVAEDVMCAHRSKNDGLPLLITPNVDQLVKLSRPAHSHLAEELKQAQWVLPDGQPIVALSKWIYGAEGLPARLPGSDFFPEIWAAIKETKATVFFVVPNEEVGEQLCSEHPFAAYFVPPFFEPSDTQTLAKVTTQVIEQARGADFLFIGLGFPKQETLALSAFHAWKKEGSRLPITSLLGASFEFYTGHKKRAPRIWQKLGLEFVHRLLSEPRRMAKRYLIDDTAFLGMAIREYRYRKGRRGNRS